MGLSDYPDRRIRSADFESENDEWLRHTIDRHISRSGNLPDAQKDNWTRSIDRRRAHSMPRKPHMNQGVGLLDAYPDYIPRSRTQQRGPPPRPFMGGPPMYDYDLDRDHPIYLKDQPNVFERLRASEYSDYILSDSEPSLSSMSSWGRRSPTSSKRRAQNHHGSSNRNSNSFSMHDISNSYNQFPIYPQNRGRSPTEKTHRSRKKELNPQEKLRRQNKPRLFVALYDYDPLSQSPNDDAVEVELSFRVGQLIKIFGDKDEDGFFKGATRDGHRGLVPCNHIAEVDVPNSSTMESLYEKGFLNSENSEKISTRQSKPKFKAPRGVSQGRKQTNSPQSERSKKMSQAKKMSSAGEMYVACYNYNPSLTSPNVDTRDEELKLQKGDVVRVLALDHDGFFYAEVNGRCGYVPSNYLQLQSKPKTEAKMNKSDKK